MCTHASSPPFIFFKYDNGRSCSKGVGTKSDYNFTIIIFSYGLNGKGGIFIFTYMNGV